MKPLYVDVDTRGIIDVVDARGSAIIKGFLITRISVPQEHRGKGVATRLLRRVLADADEEGARLYLAIMPSGGSLTAKQLERWYRRYGFKPDPQHEGVFVREPTEKMCASRLDCEYHL